MGYRFSLVLSREVTDEESEILKNAGCGAAIFATDSLPTNADVTVTKMDFDDTVSPSLAEAIESALEAVKNVPDLSVPGLTVPAQPAGPITEEPDKVIEGTVVETVTPEEQPAEEQTVATTTTIATKTTVTKTSTRKTAARKTGTRKSANGNGSSAQKGSASADDAVDPAEVAVGSS